MAHRGQELRLCAVRRGGVFRHLLKPATRVVDGCDVTADAAIANWFAITIKNTHAADTDPPQLAGWCADAPFRIFHPTGSGQLVQRGASFFQGVLGDDAVA